MSLVFRRCTEADLEILQEISIHTFRVAFQDANDPKYFEDYIQQAFNTSTILDQLQNEDSSFYFIYHQDQLVAYIKLNEKKSQTEQLDKSSIELERIYVLPEFIGQGFGKEILYKIIDIAREKKLDVLWLGVWEENKAAIRFYERHGFIKFGEHPYYIGDDKQTDWLMKFDLN